MMPDLEGTTSALQPSSRAVTACRWASLPPWRFPRLGFVAITRMASGRAIR